MPTLGDRLNGGESPILESQDAEVVKSKLDIARSHHKAKLGSRSNSLQGPILWFLCYWSQLYLNGWRRNPEWTQRSNSYAKRPTGRSDERPYSLTQRSRNHAERDAEIEEGKELSIGFNKVKEYSFQRIWPNYCWIRTNSSKSSDFNS